MHTEETGSSRLHQTVHVYRLRQIPLIISSCLPAYMAGTGSLSARTVYHNISLSCFYSQVHHSCLPPRTHGHSIGVHLAFALEALPGPFTGHVERDEAQLKPNSHFSLFPPTTRRQPSDPNIAHPDENQPSVSRIFTLSPQYGLNQEVHVLLYTYIYCATWNAVQCFALSSVSKVESSRRTLSNARVTHSTA